MHIYIYSGFLTYKLINLESLESGLEKNIRAR